MQSDKIRHNSALCNLSSGLAFICALAIYWFTADSSVSYWDCPEYTATASRLDVGHPPGNPVWSLAMRMATIPFDPPNHAYVVNLCSGLFMALSVFFLARIIYMLAEYVLTDKHKADIICPFVSTAGALCFAFCDSAWFSAVEAEVYAMSAFLSALTIWLALLWARVRPVAAKRRLLILIAYITGLSLGVHQLNLLCIPVVALIYAFATKQGKGHCMRALGILLLSFAAVGAILMGLMNGALMICEQFELFAVNTLRLPYFSGTVAYAALTPATFIASIYAAGRWPRPVMQALLFLAVWLSGITVFGSHIIAGGIMAAILSAAVWLPEVSRGRIQTGIWMLGFIWLGYSSFAMILIRGNASPPMNEGAPTDIFALHRYIARDQYGSKPLFYGATPYSRPMLREEWKPGAGTPDYRQFVLKKKRPVYVRLLPEARLHYRSGFIEAGDSAANRKALAMADDNYLLCDYSFERMTTPELDMWLPRITASSPSMIEAYGSWIGMDKTSMTSMEVSAAIDTLGNAVGKIGADGKRHKEPAWRPTYLQNLNMFLAYQAGYMYFRYLMWNFAGRQNDIPSTGEIEHGNFITGFSTIDDAMLGPQSQMPGKASADNPGHNVYYCLPFLFGIAGLIYLSGKKRRRLRTLGVTTVFFLMTGLAIVVYLNQTPGEPRERDYSFLGSFMAFSIWIAFGIIALSTAAFRRFRGKAAGYVCLAVPSVGLPALLALENLDDHNRNGRYETARFAANILAIPDGIIFTHGDNFTFPLWYAQEVEGIGKGHQVIDISYLATPEYVANLMRQGKSALSFTATQADVAYGAYAFTRIAGDADTTAIPLRDALRELYSQREGAPAFRHSRVTLPGIDGDTLTLSLRSLTTGGMIPFKQLMLLDIIATNNDSPNPKPVYFLSHIPTGFYKVAHGATRTLPFAEVYWPGADSTVWFGALRMQLQAMTDRREFDRRLPEYIEPVVADQHRRQRGALTRAGRLLLDRGHTEEAEICVRAAGSLHPMHLIEGESFTVADTTYHEGLELARLLIDIANASGKENYRKQAARYLADMRKTALDWKRYYTSLPTGRRSVVSNGTRRLILTITTVDSLLRLATANQRLTIKTDTIKTQNL